ncbi:MAG: Calx-beta domain-containing protein [Bacteroidales bacterium]
MIGTLVFFASCDNLNEVPEFSDSDSFVAFGKTTVSVSEDAATVSIPVTLASIKGSSTSITYSLVDGTAKLNDNYTLADPTATLTFDAENRTQYVVVNIVNDAGVYTGDLKFSVKLNGSSDINVGAEGTCTVTINDLDHPLAAILGTWTATGTSYFNGTESWDMEFVKDADDVSIVWIDNFVKGGSSELVYGNVNDDMTEIKVPINQVIATSTSYPLIRLEGFYGPSGDEDIPAGGYITITIAADKSSMAIQDWFGSHVWKDAGATSSGGWYNIFEADVVLSR